MTTRTTVFLEEPELVWVSTDGFFVGNSGSFFCLFFGISADSDVATSYIQNARHLRGASVKLR